MVVKKESCPSLSTKSHLLVIHERATGGAIGYPAFRPFDSVIATLHCSHAMFKCQNAPSWNFSRALPRTPLGKLTALPRRL